MKLMVVETSWVLRLVVIWKWLHMWDKRHEETKTRGKPLVMEIRLVSTLDVWYNNIAYIQKIGLLTPCWFLSPAQKLCHLWGRRLLQGQILDRGLFKGDLARLSPISIVGQWHKKAAAKKCVRPIKSHNKSSLLKYNRLASWSICDIWNGEWFWHDTSKEGAYLLRFNVVAFLFIFHDDG